MEKLIRTTILLLLGIIISSCSKIDYIETVKNGEFKDYPGKKIGISLENYMGPCVWEYTRNEEGSDLIKVKGNVSYDGIDLETTVVYQVITANDFKPVSLVIAGKEYNSQEYLEGFHKYAFTDSITNQDNVDNTNVEEETLLVFVEGGTFKMGSNEYDDEKTVHEVTVSDFYISKYEITVQDWFDFLNELDKKDFEKTKTLTTTAVKYDNDGNLHMYITEHIDNSDCPVNEVSWNGAIEFCNWLSEKFGFEKCYSGSGENIKCNFNANGFRLPTEAEWEYAARGGKKSQGFKYSGGSNYLKVAWMEENSGGKLHSVGTKQPNELGIYDMSGNVLEWCWDWYSENYYKNSPKDNPTGPKNGSYHLMRGGDWHGKAQYCRVTDRSYDYRGVYRYDGILAYINDDDIGFRIVRKP